MGRKKNLPEPKRGRGQKLWDEITEAHPVLGPEQRVILEEACRCADRLDQLDDIIAGRGVLELLHFRSMFEMDDEDERHIVMTVDGVLAEARQQQNVMKQLLVSLRLPDAATGQRPQQRGARGAYAKGATRADKLAGLRSITGGKTEASGE
ncbi:hypothetical protein [Isoptericola sp. NPDC056134]|uniref:hypothetical protein n=1 Tax=Isoptericola sp. NPDC056134 TaxID=3345723 RepID=UPI0035E93639